MAIHLDYHEAMHVIDELLKHIFRTVLRKNRAEIDVVKSHFPHEDLVFPDETIVLTFSEGVKLLRESGYKEEGEPDNVSIKELPEFEDLSTRAEVRLGELVKEKYKTGAPTFCSA
jgi:aspartyl-tRNA synthetase